MRETQLLRDGSPDPQSHKVSEAIRVSDAIRTDILNGVLEPGQRLTFPSLCAQHQVSVGVMREALVRLVFRGIVQAENNLGFKVLTLSVEGLAEHTLIRGMVEPAFLRQAVLDGSVEWESEVVAAHHVLERTPFLQGDSTTPNRAWTSAHTRFHLALVSTGRWPRIIEITTRLHDEAAIYRLWSTRTEQVDRWQLRIAEEHRTLLEAVLSRDADRAMRRLEEHIRRAASEMSVGGARAEPQVVLSDGGALPAPDGLVRDNQ